MSSINLRTIYAFAREMHPKKTTKNIEYGTAGFRTQLVLILFILYIVKYCTCNLSAIDHKN